MSLTQFPHLPDTSSYGDLYMRGGVFREVAVLNPVPSSSIGERRTRLGFFGIDSATNTQHALCVLESRAADATSRRGQLAIRVNRGNDGMDPPVDTLTLDANGDLRLFNRASERTFSIDPSGNVTAYANLSAASLSATSELKIGDKISLASDPNSGSADITLRGPNDAVAFRVSDTGLTFNDSSGGQFNVDPLSGKVVTTYGCEVGGPATFNSNVSVMGELAANTVIIGSTWRIVEVGDDGLFVQKYMDGVWANKMRIAG
jgi:hypothetical protein